MFWRMTETSSWSSWGFLIDSGGEMRNEYEQVRKLKTRVTFAPLSPPPPTATARVGVWFLWGDKFED